MANKNFGEIYHIGKIKTIRALIPHSKSVVFDDEGLRHKICPLRMAFLVKLKDDLK
jgi:hypothetical protein